MMIKSLFFTICAIVVSAISAAPQFVTFKDGKVGVNFAGFNAEAGLGGLLTGNAAHGGLSASAGTPFGQRAAAGIGGLVNGDAGGRAYAGAQATDSIGASALIGGSTGPQQRGLLGAEAHLNGNSITKTITSDVNVRQGAPQASPELVVPTDLPKESSVQRVKPPKKYSNTIENPSEFVQKTIEIRKSELIPTSVDLPPPSELPNSDVFAVAPAVTVIKNHHHHGGRYYKRIRPAARRHIYKQIIYEPLPEERFYGGDAQVKTVKTTYREIQKPTVIRSTDTTPDNQNGYQVVEKDVQLSPGGLSQFFNIPIGILQSIRDNLQPIGVRKQVTYTSDA